MPLGNILVSASILFSGSLPSKALRFLEYMNCTSITARTFYVHQQLFLQPAVNTLWKAKQSAYIEEVKQDSSPLVIGGDGRADSPGYCAKYGSYTAMDMNRHLVTSIKLVQV